jgi:nicotinamide phosphoribosyltransferase
MKATYAVVNGEERLLFKDPVTDNGTKKSQRGLVAVVEAYGQPRLVDGLDRKAYDETYKNIDLLEVVFEDGKLLRDESLSEIREMLSKNL